MNHNRGGAADDVVQVAVVATVLDHDITWGKTTLQ